MAVRLTLISRESCAVESEVMGSELVKPALLKTTVGTPWIARMDLTTFASASSEARSQM